MRLPNLLLALLILTLSPQALQAQYDKKAKHILDKMREYYKKNEAFQANFSYKREDPTQNLAESFRGSIMLKGNRYYIDLGDQEVYNNEKHVWNYLKEENEVTIVDYDPDPEELSPADIYYIYEKGFKYLYVEDKKIDGDNYSIVDLTPENLSLNYYKIRLLIHKKDHTVLQWKIFEKSGIRYSYTIDKYEAKYISDSEFVFNADKYPGVEISDLRD